jgi:hypothetical protein
VALAGCSQAARARVAGQVTVGGESLAEGVISFRPAPGTKGPEFSATIVAGDYRAAQPVLPGDYAVEIRAWRTTGRTIMGQFGKEIEERVESIAARNWGPNTELSARLESGDNRKDFALEPDPSQSPAPNKASIPPNAR